MFRLSSMLTGENPLCGSICLRELLSCLLQVIACSFSETWPGIYSSVEPSARRVRLHSRYRSAFGWCRHPISGSGSKTFLDDWNAGGFNGDRFRDWSIAESRLDKDKRRTAAGIAIC